MVTMDELAQKCDKLTNEHLSIIVKELLKAPFQKSDEFLTYGLATEVLRFFFGNEWTNDNVFPMHIEVAREHQPGRKFLKTESKEMDDEYRHMHRVINLAEIVFNLQSIDGMKKRLALMRKLDLEASLGELECVALLSNPALAFRFITPIGVTGKDYDGELKTSSGRKVNCELKTKSEKTPPGDQSLMHTLEQARTQLPKEEPAIIFVKIPEPWVIQKNIQDLIESTIEKIFRQSNRVVAIMLTWETWLVSSENSCMVLTRFRSYINEKSSLFDDEINSLTSCIGRMNNPGWVQFLRFTKEARPTT